MPWGYLTSILYLLECLVFLYMNTFRFHVCFQKLFFVCDELIGCCIESLEVVYCGKKSHLYINTWYLWIHDSLTELLLWENEIYDSSTSSSYKFEKKTFLGLLRHHLCPILDLFNFLGWLLVIPCGCPRIPLDAPNGIR